jgi:uncharacterized protein (DUF1330 family)
LGSNDGDTHAVKIAGPELVVMRRKDMKKEIRTALGVLAGFACGAAAIEAVHAQSKPPAYTVAEIEVTDPATYKKYAGATATGIPAAGGRFIVRGGKTFVLNGVPPKQIAIIQWESLEKAQAFFASEAYKELVPIRDKSSNFRAFIVEGVAP